MLDWSCRMRQRMVRLSRWIIAALLLAGGAVEIGHGGEPPRYEFSVQSEVCWGEARCKGNYVMKTGCSIRCLVWDERTGEVHSGAAGWGAGIFP